MRRWKRLTLFAFGGAAILLATLVAILVVLHRGAKDDDRSIGGLRPEDLKNVVVKLEEPAYSPALQQLHDRPSAITVETYQGPEGTPRKPAVLVSRREEDSASLSQDVLSLIVCLALAAAGGFALYLALGAKGRSTGQPK